MEKAKGLRFNKGKIKLSLCPTSIVAAVATTLQTNSEENNGKYPNNNWRLGMKWSIVIDCLQRHLEDFKNGVDVDPEDGIPTMWKVATNAAFLIEYSKTCPELDDRYKGDVFKLRDFPEIVPASKDLWQENEKIKKAIDTVLPELEISKKSCVKNQTRNRGTNPDNTWSGLIKVIHENYEDERRELKCCLCGKVFNSADGCKCE